VDAYLRPPGFASWCLRMRPDGWYAPRSYPHFDLPLPFDAAKAYVTDPARVCRHGFHPFLRFDITRRRYRANRDGAAVSKKSRPIASPAHVDGYIFAFIPRCSANATSVRLLVTEWDIASWRTVRG
jgi:hypothetical protein